MCSDPYPVSRLIVGVQDEGPTESGILLTRKLISLACREGEATSPVARPP